MLISIVALIVGLIITVWSADRFVDGASGIAKHFKMPPMLIGMVIIGFGTSAPEIAVSVQAAIEGNSGISLGNAIGSNITNIALVLGVTAIIAPIIASSSVLKKEVPMMLGAMFLALILMLDGSLSVTDGIILLFAFVLTMGWSIFEGLKKKKDNYTDEVEIEIANKGTSVKSSALWLVLGIVLLIVGSKIFVYGAQNIALSLGISDMVVGLTVVAIGTSLPELASSIMAARKGEHELALGNVLGSNLFNILIVVGIAVVISPMSIPSEVITRDMFTAIVLSFILLVVCLPFSKKVGSINRFDGVLLVVVFIMYTTWLVLDTLGIV